MTDPTRRHLLAAAALLGALPLSAWAQAYPDKPSS